MEWNTNINITNTGSKPAWGQCSVAFYDQNKNLIGTAAQTLIARRGLKPRAQKAETWRIILPKDKYKDIVSYQVVINETSTPPSKQKESILLEDPERRETSQSAVSLD